MILRIPLFDQLKRYNQQLFRNDLVAGITVGVMLIPQGMAYAMLAGLPPVYGLYASTVPLLMYAFLGTSRQLAVGPVAMVSLLTAAGIGMVSEAGSETFISLAILLALLVGLFQFFMGVFRLGFLVNFLSHPVISGFTSAAALIIGFSQLKHLFGVSIPSSHHVHEIVAGVIKEIGNTNMPTLAIGLISIALIIILKKVDKRIPALLITVILSILVVWFGKLAEVGVSIVGDIPKGIPQFSLPNWDIETVNMLLPTVLAIGLVSFMESIAVAKAIQSKHKDYKVIPNQELIALGMSNIVGSLFQAYPTTGGFSRTAVNDEAGAKTGISSIISALLILLTLLILTPLFYNLPHAVLASVIMVSVFGLIDFHEAIHLWKVNKIDFTMLMVTFIATLLLGIEQGIMIGVLLSIGMIIYKSSRPHIAILGKVPGTPHYRNIKRFETIHERPDILIFRFDAQIYFANASYFLESLEEEISRKGTELKVIIINAESINSIDSSAIVMLEDLLDKLKENNIDIYFTSAIGPVRDILEKNELTNKIGEQNFFMSIQEAIDSYDHRPSDENKNMEIYTLQSNIKE